MDYLSLAGGAGGCCLVLLAIAYRSGLLEKLLSLLSKKQTVSPTKVDNVRPGSELEVFLARHQRDQERLDAERTMIHDFLNQQPPGAGVPLGVFPKPEKTDA